MMTACVVIAPLAAALLTMLFRPLNVRRVARIVIAAVVAALPLTLLGHADWLSLLFAGLVSLISFFATVFSTGMYSVDWGRGRAVWTRKSVYFVLLGTFWSAMLLVVLATNFGLLWFGIAATTLATAFLVGFSGDATALEAAWKYLVLCSVGIGLALLGIVLLGRVSLELGIDPAHALAWSAITQYHVAKAVPPAALATAIMLIGFATKAGLVPMHALVAGRALQSPGPDQRIALGGSRFVFALRDRADVDRRNGAGSRRLVPPTAAWIRRCIDRRRRCVDARPARPQTVAGLFDGRTCRHRRAGARLRRTARAHRSAPAHRRARVREVGGVLRGRARAERDGLDGVERLARPLEPRSRWSANVREAMRLFQPFGVESLPV